MKNNQKRTDENNYDFLKHDKAIAVLSSLVLLFSFVLLFTACEASQTTTTTPTPNANTTVQTPQANKGTVDLENVV